MKHILFLGYILLSLAPATAQIQTDYSLLPEPVKRFFPVVYHLPDSVNVEWSIEDTIFVAKFLSDAYPVEVRMKANGFWVITLWDIEPSFLPAAITLFCQTEYPDASIQRCRLTNNPFDEQRYVIVMQPFDPGASSFKLYFTTSGKPLQE